LRAWCGGCGFRHNGFFIALAQNFPDALDPASATMPPHPDRQSLPPPRKRTSWLLLLCAGLLLMATARLFFDIDQGQLWRKHANYTDRQKGFGYAVVGRFGGMSFPAVIVGRADDVGGIAFTDPQGQKRRYSNFNGYRLKAVTFQPIDGKRQPFVMVLRRTV